MIIVVCSVANLRILLSLLSTDMFGQVIRNLFLMVLKTVSFAGILILSISAFAAYIFMIKLFDYPWSNEYVTTWSNLFDSMLGNYESEDWNVEIAGWQGLITFIIYMFYVALLTLNLLIAVLSDVYRHVNNKANIDKLLLQLELSTMYTPHPKYTSLTLTPAPVNVLSLPLLPLMFVERGVKYYNNITRNGFFVLILAPVCIAAILALN